jgi:hypothetical protein
MCDVRRLRAEGRKMHESLELSKQVCIFAAERSNYL